MLTNATDTLTLQHMGSDILKNNLLEIYFLPSKFIACSPQQLNELMPENDFYVLNYLFVTLFF